MGARHLGGNATLVNEDQALRTDALHSLPVDVALGGDLIAVLLGGPKRLFLRVSFRLLSVRHNTGGLTRWPVRSAKRSPCSASVASLHSMTNLRRTASAGASRRGGDPPLWGFA